MDKDELGVLRWVPHEGIVGQSIDFFASLDAPPGEGRIERARA